MSVPPPPPEPPGSAPDETSAADDPDRIVVVEDGPEIEEIVKGSRFLGQVFRVQSEADAEVALAAVRARYPDASHHCSAFRLGDPDHAASLRERYDDDGEPNRTAGAPILTAIEGAGVSDVFVVVTRYFGGTKLGKGGLVRAYGGAARIALDAAPRAVQFRRATLRIEVSYDDLGTIESLVGRHANVIFSVDREFEPSPRLTVILRASQAPLVERECVDATGGRARVTSNPPPSQEPPSK